MPQTSPAVDSIAALEKRIKDNRSLLAGRMGQAPIGPDDQAWDAMVRAHLQARAALHGSPGRLVIESFRLDFDLLRHFVRRWVLQIDADYWRNARH